MVVMQTDQCILSLLSSCTFKVTAAVEKADTISGVKAIVERLVCAELERLDLKAG